MFQLQPLSEWNNFAHPPSKMETFALIKYDPYHEDPALPLGHSFRKSSSPALSCRRNHPTNSRPHRGLANTRTCNFHPCGLGAYWNTIPSTFKSHLPLLHFGIEFLQALRNMPSSPPLATDGEVHSRKGDRHGIDRVHVNRGIPAHALLFANNNYAPG